LHLDVQDLRDFYYRHGLGRAVRMQLRRRLLSLWPDVRGQTMVGYGFATPVLRPYLSTARRVIALMPGPQGVMPWPANLPNVSVLSAETEWPLDTGHVDRLVVLHGLETSEHAFDLLEEIWRVLGPGGRVVFIVPSRAGLWARRDATPFGYGRPYSLRQLEAQLHRHQFLPERHCGALYQFPSHKRIWMKSAPLFERLGKFAPGIVPGGVLMVEASKRVWPPKGKVRRTNAPSVLPVWEGTPKPVAGRGTL
jgi:SAM-dependent methyltransferase